MLLCDHPSRSKMALNSPKTSVVSAVRKASRLHSWALPKQSSSVAPPHVWSNIDQDPVPRERRTWTGWTFVLYWFSDLVTFSTWSQGSSVVAAGLSATDAVLICLVASLCNALPICLNGAIGSNLHIPFPVAARAAYGYWLSYFAIASRAVLALFWFGINSAGKFDLRHFVFAHIIYCSRATR